MRAGLNIAVLSKGFAVMRFLCMDAESYVECLKLLVDSTYGWCNPEQTPRQHFKENEDVPYWAGTIDNSFHAQKALAVMDRNMFQAFPLQAEQNATEKA